MNPFVSRQEEKPAAFAVLMLFISMLFCFPVLKAAAATPACDGTRYQIDDIIIEGTGRTNRVWLLDYLDLKVPLQLSPCETELLVTKIKTTDVFESVSATLEQGAAAQESAHVLHIRLKEKWTTIPVLRGAYGGGTPLIVAGIYDTHSFGRLWTLGIEGRKYGNAEPGGTLWVRAPRFLQGKYSIGLELWKDSRIRSYYGKDLKQTGELHTNANFLRGFLLVPIGQGSELLSAARLQMGLDLLYKRQYPSSLKYETVPAPTAPQPHFNQATSEQSKIALVAVFDNITIDGLLYKGLRLTFNSGALIKESGVIRIWEYEGFYYQPLLSNYNLATHLYVGAIGSSSLEHQFYLGGLDSIRGLPDGALHGSHAAYFNAELRKTLSQFRYVALQGAIFSDTGGAAASGSELARHIRTTMGVGIRLSFPRIHRFMFRLDYAFSPSSQSVSGINAGMNDFFQPYRPL
jgi:outer membrane protein assembly factor BamA